MLGTAETLPRPARSVAVMKIDRLGPDDLHRVLAAPHLFDEPPREEWTARFLMSEGHHLLMAAVDGTDVGFVSGVETTHPDKGTEMFLYELGVDESHRGHGIGTALVGALVDLAKDRGCYGMWVSTEADNVAALGAYRAAGAGVREPGVVLTWQFGLGRGDGGSAAAGAGGDRVGDVDPQPQQRGAERLAEVVGPQRPGRAATERVVQHELEGQHVAGLEPLDRAPHESAEVAP